MYWFETTLTMIESICLFKLESFNYFYYIYNVQVVFFNHFIYFNI